MTKTKIALWSAGGVLSAVGTFFAGYFTGKAMERKRLTVVSETEEHETKHHEKTRQPHAHA